MRRAPWFPDGDRDPRHERRRVHRDEPAPPSGHRTRRLEPPPARRGRRPGPEPRLRQRVAGRDEDRARGLRSRGQPARQDLYGARPMEATWFGSPPGSTDALLLARRVAVVFMRTRPASIPMERGRSSSWTPPAGVQSHHALGRRSGQRVVSGRRMDLFQRPCGELFLVHPDGSGLHRIPLELPRGARPEQHHGRLTLASGSCSRCRPAEHLPSAGWLDLSR